MRRLITTINIYEDDSPEVVEGQGLARNNKPNGTHEILLPPSNNNPTSLAHELGHVVAHIYRTKASRLDDLASNMAGMFYGSRDAIQQFKDGMRIKYVSEEEAWRIARDIYPELDEKEAEEALDSYKQGIEKAPYSLKG